MRVFNALNGQEVKDIILAEIRRAMDGDMQFQKHLTYPLIEWEWKVNAKAYPSEPGEFSAEAEGAVKVKAVEPQIIVLEGRRQVMKTESAPEAGQAPDEARRDAGLPLLETVRTAGGVVDAPSAFAAALQQKATRR